MVLWNGATQSLDNFSNSYFHILIFYEYCICFIHANNTVSMIYSKVKYGEIKKARGKVCGQSKLCVRSMSMK